LHQEILHGNNDQPRPALRQFFKRKFRDLFRRKIFAFKVFVNPPPDIRFRLVQESDESIVIVCSKICNTIFFEIFGEMVNFGLADINICAITFASLRNAFFISSDAIRSFIFSAKFIFSP
jgi:hypothetical protein